MNLPNKLTLLRILLIPVFMIFVSFPQFPYSYLIAGAVFAIASFTDFLDGAIARKRNLVTDFGKFADPLADKLLTTVAFIYMLLDGVCHPIVLVIIIAREFAVSGVRMVAASSPEGKVIAANIWGKMKTALMMITIVAYYVMVGLREIVFTPIGVSTLPEIVTIVLCWLVAVITALSGVQYIWENRSFINTTK